MDVYLPAHFLLLAAITFTLSFASVYVVMRVCRAKGWVAAVRQDRWHTQPVALYGGVGFIPPFLAVGVTYYLLAFGASVDLKTVDSIEGAAGQTLAALVGAGILFLVGILDDVWQLRPGSKLVAQLFIASLFVYFGGVFPVTGWHPIDLTLSYVWLVGVTNALNLLDNMDGLASGAAIISAVSVLFICLLGGDQAPSAVAIAGFLATAHFAFWLSNKRPAKIFMGDSGSLATGFMLASLTMPSAWNNHLFLEGYQQPYRGLLTLLLPAAILCLPILDTAFVTLTRLLNARKPHVGGCDHTSHRLVRLGLSQRRAVLVLHGLAVVGGVIALLTRTFPDQALPLLGVLGLGVALFGGYLSHVPTAEQLDAPKPGLMAKVTQGLLLRWNGPQMLLDVVLVVTCFWLAYLLRFDFTLEPFLKNAMLRALPLVVACSIFGMRLAGVYGRSWRHATTLELPAYGMGAFWAAALSLAAAALLARFGEGYSRSAFIIFGFLLFISVSLTRLGFSILDSLVRKTKASDLESSMPVLIYGAGRAGKFLLEEIHSNKQLEEYFVVGFIDDDPTLNGAKVSGMLVLQPEQWLERKAELCLAGGVLEVWISSELVPNEKALNFASKLGAEIIVKRQIWSIQPVA